MTAPIKLVYSSAPEDYPFAKQLAAHLHTHTQHGLLSAWDEQFLPAGTDVAQERRRAWREADILLLLLSADYFSSAAYDEQEMQQALKRHKADQLLIVPILVRPFAWQASVVSHLQCLPRSGRAVTISENRDAALDSVGQDLRQLIAARRASDAPLSALQRTNRQRLLKIVRTIWVDGWLEQSLHHATWIDLHLQKQPHGLESPWRLMVQELDRGPRPLPPGTSIIQVFDEADEELLILGEPGSGKTTLLMYLARTLLDRAEADECRRIPVVLNLSSWARKRPPLDQWLIEEMNIRYQVPLNVGRTWVETNQLFPLLDGLDEVAEAERAACTQAIIAYMQREQERIPLIICCRIEEYQALSVELPLQYAVILLPLSDEQIEVYLSSVSGKLDTLRQVLREDRELFELARRPLMLAIFTQAYHGEAVLDLPAAMTSDEYPRALFRQYVKRMLKRRTKLQQITEEQFLKWLTYFATQLYRQQQTIFAVEELQPAWLSEQYRSHYRWGMLLAYILTFGLFFGPIFGLAFGAAYGIIYWVLNRLLFGVIFGLVLGIVGGLSGGLVFGLVFKQHETIQPAEIAAWSWTSARKGLLVGVLGGLVFALVGGLVGWVVAGPIGGMVVGCVVEGIMGPLGGLVGGLSPKQMPERLALSPNEGIWRSGKRGMGAVLLLILLVGMTAGLIVGRLGASISDLRYGLIFGLVFGSVGGLIFALTFSLVGGRTGLAAFLEHFVLRFFLWRHGLLPWKLVAFLDEATERLLLRKVGGSYIFVHRLLRDVLATYNT
ncbi:MAG: TIR domain-containing protein [Chloroflexi bacterium]|nr:MAG: TIR domain-containing protein [Chloroflexota bacterium]